MCNKECNTEGACPFAFSEESELVQNYGCLPSPADIVEMRVKHGKTWACHDNPSKPCKGALLYMKEYGIPCKIIDNELLTEDSDWQYYCTNDDFNIRDYMTKPYGKLGEYYDKKE